MEEGCVARPVMHVAGHSFLYRGSERALDIRACRACSHRLNASWPLS